MCCGGPLPSLTSETAVLTALCAGLGSGAMVDTACRRIPNGISMGTAAIGVVLAATGISGVSLTSSLFGFFLGFLLMLPGHLLGATGAGDVKLFAAAGAVVGAGMIVPAFLMTAVAGGLLAVGIAWWRGRLVPDVSIDGAAVRTIRNCEERYRVLRRGQQIPLRTGHRDRLRSDDASVASVVSGCSRTVV